jgi:hypothetical protein
MMSALCQRLTKCVAARGKRWKRGQYVVNMAIKHFDKKTSLWLLVGQKDKPQADYAALLNAAMLCRVK